MNCSDKILLAIKFGNDFDSLSYSQEQYLDICVLFNFLFVFKASFILLLPQGAPKVFYGIPFVSLF